MRSSGRGTDRDPSPAEGDAQLAELQCGGRVEVEDSQIVKQLFDDVQQGIRIGLAECPGIELAKGDCRDSHSARVLDEAMLQPGWPAKMG